MSIKRLKKYYPKDMTFCIYGDECPMSCCRKISDYELRLLKFEVVWADFKYTNDCILHSNGQV